MGTYDVALICLNGHIVNDAMKDNPWDNAEFCKDCGAKTISKCLECGTDIKGTYYENNPYYIIFPVRLSKAPMYCHSCGAPYPWTVESIKAFKEIAGMDKKLSKEEREQLSNSIDDIVSDTPRTGKAILFIKRVARKMSKETWSIIRDIIVKVGTEAAKKNLGL